MLIFITETASHAHNNQQNMLLPAHKALYCHKSNSALISKCSKNRLQI